MPVLTRYEQRQVRHDSAGVPAWFREELLAFPEGEHDDGVDAPSYAGPVWTASPAPARAVFLWKDYDR